MRSRPCVGNRGRVVHLPAPGRPGLHHTDDLASQPITESVASLIRAIFLSSAAPIEVAATRPGPAA